MASEQAGAKISGYHLEVDHVSQVFPASGRSGVVQALDDVSLTVAAGSTMAIVGESGSGKSTLARAILGLTPPSEGHIRVFGEDVYAGNKADRTKARAGVQVVFQNPHSSLDPTMSVDKIICEPQRRSSSTGQSKLARAQALLEKVGLPSEYALMRPFQLSGGEQQRVAIARAIGARPSLLVLDEPTSSIDVASRRDVLRLLRQLQRDEGLTYIFITHDLVAARYMADETTVLYGGKIVERGTTQDVLEHPEHEYTRALVKSALSVHGSNK